MKIVGALFVCLLLSFAAVGQPDGKENEAKIAVEEIALFKTDGAGGIGDETESFLTTDVPIHCSILLSSADAAAVKMNIVAVKAAGLKSESKVVTVSYKTNGKQNQVNFTASPADVWAAGKYRVDIFIDGKLSAKKEFEIIKPALE